MIPKTVNLVLVGCLLTCIHDFRAQAAVVRRLLNAEEEPLVILSEFAAETA